MRWYESRWVARSRQVVLTLIILFLGIVGLLNLWPICSGIYLRSQLLSEIVQAKSIKIFEHSSPFDHFPESELKEKIYSETSLNQIVQFKKALPIAWDSNFFFQSRCLFNPHHRIEIVRPNGTLFKIEICFICNELKIQNEKKYKFLPVWEKSLRNFISSLGMKPDQLWHELFESSIDRH